MTNYRIERNALLLGLIFIVALLLYIPFVTKSEVAWLCTHCGRFEVTTTAPPVFAQTQPDWVISRGEVYYHQLPDDSEVRIVDGFVFRRFHKYCGIVLRSVEKQKGESHANHP